TLESQDPSSLRVYWSGKTPFRVEEFTEFRDPQRLAQEDLIEAILHDRATRTPISEGAKTLELTLAAIKAMETGKAVSLPLD
ncbi:MAG: hypothetical protein J7J99_07260, partial [Thermoprotei archaeon]|nr:hypothetical protein [Thermoprotei archaeon]